jgi:hypothetical protein
MSIRTCPSSSQSTDHKRNRTPYYYLTRIIVSMHSNSINIILDRNIALWNLKFKSKDALDVFGIVKELYNSRTPNTMKRSSHAFSKKLLVAMSHQLSNLMPPQNLVP